MENYKVSIIIPVYNAAQYVERAVESVIHLSETGEIILIDDASSDSSMQVCKKLVDQNKNIRLFEHVDKKNHGAAASRNVGINNARYDYVCFLDADDYYLPNRFTVEKDIFFQNPDVDGVYGCTVSAYESNKSKELFYGINFTDSTTFTKIIEPKDLFKALMLGGYGRFHTSGITIRKKTFARAGVFNENIRYVEDTEFWCRLSLQAKLVAGSISEPVAVRGVHENNSIYETVKIEPHKRQMYIYLFNWAVKKPFSFEVKNLFFNALLHYTYDDKISPQKLLIKECLKNPQILFTSFFFKKLHLTLTTK